MYRTTNVLARFIDEVQSLDDLHDAMGEVTRLLGFDHFAISHHVDIARTQGPALRIHDYPEQWAAHYEGEGLGVSDPVHRASHRTSMGFRWSRLPELIPLTAADRRMLDMGQAQGIGDGFTVPVHVPGEARGTCSYASRGRATVSDQTLPLAQFAGTMAFEAARRLAAFRVPVPPVGRALTDRQRDCVLWAARGKTDWEISIILDISEETVARHVRHACGRYGVHKRSQLAIHTLYDGTLTFGDVLPRHTPLGE